jgi:hypothetical protein
MTAFKQANDMAKDHSSNFWLSQFVLRLMELQPSLPMLHAVQYAVMQYPYASSLEPENAASIFASGHPGLSGSIAQQPAGLRPHVDPLA